MRLGLKAYVIASIVIVASLVGYICLRHIDRVMSDGLRSIQKKQIESVFQITTSTLNMVKDELQRGSRVLRSDNDLASAFVLASETKDLSLIQRKLKHLQEKMNLDHVDILTSDGQFICESAVGMAASFLQNQTAKEGFFLREEESVFLFFFSPLELYGEAVGTLVLGRNLNSSLQSKIADLTGAQLLFSLTKPMEQQNSSRDLVESKEIFTSGATPLFAEVRVGGTQFDRIITDSRKDLVVWLGVSFLLLLIVIFVLFERGFVKPLHSFLNLLRKTSRSIDEGQIPLLQVPRHRIKEIDVVAKAFGKMVQNLSVYDNRIKEQSKREAEIQKDLAVAELAKQVAHDIRSPIGTLEGVLKLAEGGRWELVEQTGRNAIQLIKDIADTLDPYQSLESKEKVQKVLPLVEEVLAEMRVRYPDVQFITEFQSSDCESSVKIQSVEFKRILTNVVNNGVEALTLSNRVIRLKVLKSKARKMLIEISDSGVGIDEALLSEIGKLGFSVGKTNGRGRGIYHAKQTLAQWNGSLRISSRKNEGTTVIMELPVQEIQSSYLPSKREESEISTSDSPVDLVLIDNFKYTRDSWTAIAKRLKLNILCLERPDDQLLRNLKRETPLFIDLDLDNGLSGFEVAEGLFDQGFTNIYITTGNRKAVEGKNRKPDYVRQIVDKQFPWWLKKSEFLANDVKNAERSSSNDLGML